MLCLSAFRGNESLGVFECQCCMESILHQTIIYKYIRQLYIRHWQRDTQTRICEYECAWSLCSPVSRSKLTRNFASLHLGCISWHLGSVHGLSYCPLSSPCEYTVRSCKTGTLTDRGEMKNQSWPENLGNVKCNGQGCVFCFFFRFFLLLFSPLLTSYLLPSAVTTQVDLPGS